MANKKSSTSLMHLSAFSADRLFSFNLPMVLLLALRRLVQQHMVLVSLISVFFLSACGPSEDETISSGEMLSQYSEKSVEELFNALDKHYRSMASDLSEEELKASYRAWWAISVSLKNKGASWTTSEQVNAHLSAVAFYLSSYENMVGVSDLSIRLNHYLESERSRLSDITATRRATNTQVRDSRPGCTYDCGNDSNMQNPPNPNDGDEGGDGCETGNPDGGHGCGGGGCGFSCKVNKLKDKISGAFNNGINNIKQSVGNAVGAAAAAFSNVYDAITGRDDEEEENVEIAKDCNSCSENPIEYPTGAKITYALDADLGFLRIERKHRISQKSAWSLGKGWHFSLDSRVILGVSPDISSEISTAQATVSNLEAEVASIDSEILFYQTNYVDEPGYSSSSVQSQIANIVSQLNAQRSRIIHSPELPNDPLVEARALLNELQQRQSIANSRRSLNSVSVDSGFADEAEIGNDRIKWVSPGGSRFVFYDDVDSGTVTATGGHSNQLERTSTGYRVRTSSSVIYEYDQYGLLVRVISETGEEISIERDSEHRAFVVVDQDGRSWNLEYNGQDHLVRVTDPANRRLSLAYDGQGRLVSADAFDGTIDQYQYGYSANPLVITARTDGEGNSSEYQFAEQNGQTVITRQYDPADNDWSYQYFPDQNKTLMTNRRGLVTHNFYNEDYKPTETQYGSYGSKVFSYDTSGNLVAQYNELNEATTYTYDQLGQVLTVTDATGRTITFDRNAEGVIVGQTDGAGNTTQFIRDLNGKIIRVELPDGSNISQDWTDGKLSRRVDQDGNITEWEYDNHGCPARIDYYGQQVGDSDDAFQKMENDAICRVQTVTEGGAATPESDWRTTEYFYYDAESGRDLDQPVRIVDPSGREARYEYDGNSQLVYQRDFSGVETYYSYTPRQNLASKTIEMPDPTDAGEVIEYHYSYEYDAEENLIRAEHPGGIVWLYEYDARNRLVRSEIEGTDVVRTVSYDAAGRAITENDNAGGLYQYSYFADGQVQSQTNPLGNVRSFGYDARGDLASISDSARGAEVARYDRDALGRVTAVTSGNGHVQRLELNGRGLPVTRYQPDSYEPRYQHQYDWRGKMIATSDAEGGQLVQEINAFGEVIRIEDSEGGVVDREYDTLGRKVLEVSPSGQLSTWDYDQQADRLVVTQEDRDPSFSSINSERSRVSVKTYDLMGRLIEYQDAEEQLWTFSYNELGLLATTTNPDGSQVVNEYDDAGQLIAETQVAAPGDYSDDRVTSYERDGAGRVTAVRKPNYPSGTADRVQYNGLGLPVSVTQADLMRVDYDYDGAGRRIAAYHPGNLNEYWAYDANDNLTDYTDQDGYRWQFNYNADNQRSWSFDPVAVAQGMAYPGGLGTQTHYDAVGRVVGSTDPLGNTTEWRRDSVGRVIAQLDAYGVPVVYQRDEAGRIVAQTDRTGATTSYGYNAFGDVEQVTDALGNSTSVTYDQLGRQQRTVDALGNSRQWDYNHRSQVTAETDPLGRTTAQSYNSFGNLTAVARPGPNGTITSRYEWRADNRLIETTLAVESAAGATQRYDYDAMGRMTRATNELGNQWQYQYDLAGNLARINQPEAGTDIEYGYNGRGMVTERRYAGANGQQQVDHLNYDGARRLASIENPALNESYSYDAAGRMTKVNNQTLGQEFELGYDANGQPISRQLTADDFVEYERDDQGRIVTIERTTGDGDVLVFDLERDELGRVVQVDYPNKSRRKISYDDLGRVSAILIEQQGLGWGHHWDNWSNPWGGGKDWLWDKGHWNNHPWDGGNQSNGHGGWRNDDDDESHWRGRRTGPWSPGRHWNWRHHGDYYNQWTTVERFEYEYDAAGNLVESKRNGQRSRFAYDSLNRLVEADYPGWDDIHYRWDDRGNLTRKTTRYQRYDYQYDQANQLKSFESQRLVGFGCRNWFDWYRCSNNDDWRDGRHGWGWGSNGNDHSWGHDDRWDDDYHYEYDRNGYPTKLSSHSQNQTFEHDALGRMTAVDNPNGNWVDYAYDSRDRRVQTVQGDHWRPDDDDDDSSNNSNNNQNNRGWGSWGGWNQGRRDHHPWWDKYPHNKEPLVLQSHYVDRQEIGQWREREDWEEGDETWSEYRSLTGLPMDDGMDAGGRTLSGTGVEDEGLPYDQILHQELDEPYRWELKAGGMRGTDPRHLFLYGDHLGSTVQVRDADGKGALRLGYSPFGQVYLKHSDYSHWSPADGSASAQEQLGNLMPYQYTGRYTEATTGLVHLDARWYNPQTQRFVQPDLWNFRNTGLPMAVRHELMRFTGLDTAQLLRDPGQQMGYGYVSGNPLAWSDLVGLSGINVPKMTSEERENFLVSHNVSTADLLEFQSHVGDLLKTPGGIEEIRQNTPAYENLSDMAIYVRENFGRHYIEDPDANSILKMSQYDGQTTGIQNVMDTIVGSIPMPVGAIKKIDILQSAVNFLNGMTAINGQGELTNEELLAFYGSQICP